MNAHEHCFYHDENGDAVAYYEHATGACQTTQSVSLSYGNADHRPTTRQPRWMAWTKANDNAKQLR